MQTPRHFPYPITIRLLNGYFEVSAPDFGIVIAKKRIEDVNSSQEMGALILDVMNEALTKFGALQNQGKPVPTPSKPRGALSSLDEITELIITMKEVQAMLKVSDETVRRLCRKGELNPILTQGGHRRFRLREVQEYTKKQFK